MKIIYPLVLITLSTISCGGSSGGNPANDATSLGSNFTAYAEKSESNNNAESTSEITPYILDTNGLKISGAFESSGVSYDYYRFNTGTYGTVHVDVYINGVKQTEANHKVSISLNSYVNDGYSTLWGNGYFINASVSPAATSYKDYVIGISQSISADVAGMTYTIEIRHVP